MLRRIFLTVSVLLLTCLTVSAAETTKVRELKGDFQAKTAEEKFVKALVKTLTPESLEVIFDGAPGVDGTLAKIYIGARGISAGTDYRLDSFALTGSLVKLTPPDRWDAGDIKSFRPDKWDGFFNVEIVLTEKDAKNAIKSFIGRGGSKADKWRDLQIDFRPSTLIAKGTYHINSGMNAAFVVKTGLELRGGKQIWLVNTDVQINRDDQTDAIREEIRKINPPVDFSDMEIPVTLRSLSITDREIRIRTATVPQPFTGTVYRYKKHDYQVASCGIK